MSRRRSHIVRISLIVALGGFLMGFDASVISGVIRFIEPEFDLSKIELGWAVGSLTLAATLAMLVSGPLSDRYGRIKMLRIAASLYLISALLSAIAPSFILLVIARMIGGMGVGASLIIAPMYIAEISPPKSRGAMVSFNQLNIVFGISVAFFSNYIILQLSQSDASWVKSLLIDQHTWRWMLGVEAIAAIVYLAGLYTVPRSPRWLMMKGREREALSILSSTSPNEEARATYQEIIQSLETNRDKPKSRLKDLFSPALRTVLLIGTVIAILQQITGINAVFFYAPTIFERSGINVDAAFSQAILVGLTNLVFTILAMLLIDRIGRKPLLVIGAAGIAVSMFLLAYGFKAAEYRLEKAQIEQLGDDISIKGIAYLQDKTYQSEMDFRAAITLSTDEGISEDELDSVVISATRFNNQLILVSILAFVAFFAVSIGPVMWVLFSELFPNTIRAIAVSFVGFINSATSFLIQLIFPWELDVIGPAATFLLFGVFAAAGLGFIIIKVPETKGKSLESLQKMLFPTGSVHKTEGKLR